MIINLNITNRELCGKYLFLFYRAVFHGFQCYFFCFSLVFVGNYSSSDILKPRADKSI